MVSRWATEFRENMIVVVPVLLGMLGLIGGLLARDVGLISIGAGLIGIPGFVRTTASGGNTDEPQ